MSRWTEPTRKQEKAWKAWLARRPKSVRAIAEKFEPWSLYRMKSTGKRVTIHSFNENGTLTVNITGEFNLIMFDRQVFGIDPDDLEPTDLPAADEPCGTLLAPSEVDIDALRELARNHDE